MKNKPRVFITIHPRGKNSLGENRQCLQHAAFHWGILISPKPTAKTTQAEPEPHHAFDVTDSMDLDPVTGIDNNPDRNWRFRARVYAGDDPALAFQVLARVMVGKVPARVRLADVREKLESIPLPERVSQEQNCVSWTREAIRELRGMGLVERFEDQRLIDDALGFADECLAGSKEMGTVMNYTERKID